MTEFCATFRPHPVHAGRPLAGVRTTLLLVLALLATGCGRGDVALADGQQVSWSQWDGHWLVINYWAEWCAPCREEIPELNRLHRAGTDAQVVVLGVNFDGITGAGMDRLIDLFAIEFPILLADPAPRWNQSRPAILPTTLVIDPEGRLHATLVGPQTYESLAEVVGLAAEASSADDASADEASADQGSSPHTAVDGDI